MESEIEIKLKIVNFGQILQKLMHIGCLRIYDFQFEDNFLYDFHDLSLKERGVILRIREYGKKFTVTLKEKIHDDPLYKIHSETEVQIDDPAAAKMIFEALGLRVIYRYQKYRAEYKVGDLSVFIDKTPVGDFIELEGAKEDIDARAEQLGYSKHDYINISYRAYHINYLKERGLPPSDMLFAARGKEGPDLEEKQR